MRPCDIFLNQRGNLLGNHGFVPDAGCLERTASGNIVIYHYSRSNHIENILSADGGLNARLNVVHCEVAPEFEGCFLAEALLEPLPSWICDSPYFGDLGMEMMKAYVGNTLLRIELPPDFPNLFIADTAHNFDCKHLRRKGTSALHLGYDCSSGQEVCKAEINSYVPLLQYHGGHVAPNVKIIRYGEGIVVPSRYITINKIQPLA